MGREHPDSGGLGGGMEMGKLNAYSLEAVYQEVSPSGERKGKDRKLSLSLVVWGIEGIHCTDG